MMRILQLNSEEKHIALAAKGERRSQEFLYNKYSSKMLGVCRLYIKDLHFAEDVMISGFMNVFLNISGFEGKGSFEGWMRRVMINESISFLRGKKMDVFLEEDDAKMVEMPLVDEDFSAEELQRMIDKLPDGYRTVFSLYVIEGYKHQEIAELLGINEGTSKSQLSHAKRMLREEIEKVKTYCHEAK